MIEAGEPVTPEALAGSGWDVDIAGRIYPAVVSLRPVMTLR
jgi:hypothetical protein